MRLQAGAEASLARIAADLPDLPQPRLIHIQLVRDASSIASVAPAGRGAPAYAIGVTYPDLGVVTVAMRRGAEFVDPMSTLDHELGHVALGAALGDRAPHWLHEGFAYQHSAEWSWDRAETLAGMVWLRGIIPLEQLDRSFPAEEVARQSRVRRELRLRRITCRGAAAGRITTTTAIAGRSAAFSREIGHGTDIDAAAKHQFGKPLHELFDEWRDDLQSRYLIGTGGPARARGVDPVRDPAGARVAPSTPDQSLGGSRSGISRRSSPMRRDVVKRPSVPSGCVR